MNIDAQKKKEIELKKVGFLQTKAGMISVSVLLSLVISGLAYFLWVGPEFDRVGPGKELDVQSLQAQLQAKESEQNNLQALRNELDSLTAEQVELISRMLPDKTNVPELLSQVEAIGRSSGISVASINIAEAEETDTRSARQQLQEQLNQQANAAARSSDIRFLIVRVNFSANNYASLKSFIENIQSHTRILDIQRFNYDTENQTQSLTFHAYFIEE